MAVWRVRGVAIAASVAVVLVGLVTGMPPAAGATAAPATTSTSPNGPAHPDTDYLGSTVGTHETVTPQARVATTQSTTAGSTTATTPGLDVSHYQGTVDWNSVAAQGAKFAYMKATESTTYVDPRFSANYAGSANAGLVRGAYHFALPDRSSGAAQAMFFLGNGGGWVGDGRTLPPVLDIEYNPYGTANWAGWCYGLTAAQMSAWITDFATTIHDRTNRWPVIYTTNGWWSHCTGNDASFGNDPLWIAPSNSDAGGPPTIPASWSAYTFFQNATSGTFPGDQDVFNGAPDQLLTFTAGDTPDKIVTHYNQLGGTSSYLGSPTGSEYPIAGGWAQNYEHGIIYYSPAPGAWAVDGAILSHYQQLGGPGGVLGFPTSDETGTSDGVGRYNDFAIGSIYWTSDIGARAVQGQIRNEWRALGAEQGLGYPTTDETATPDGVGRYNHFSAASGASIYWTPSTGAHAIQGQIRSKWAALGWERGLGYPTTDDSTTPDGVGRYNHFSAAIDASIYWTPNTGAHAIQGQIRTKWAALGWEKGLGYPTTDETTTPDGIGRYNHFTNSASIYWTPGTGAWSIYGAIRDKWASLGWETSPLAYPTSDEYGVTGGRRNNFQHGTITWYSADGSTQVAYN